MLRRLFIALAHRPHFSKALALDFDGVEGLADGVGEQVEELVAFFAGGERHAEGDAGAAAGAADDVDVGLVAVQNLDAFADVAHADAGAFADEAGDGSGGGAAGFDAYAVVFDFEEEAAFVDAGAEGDGAAGDAGFEAMLDRVFDERLKEHGGDDDVEGVVGDLLDDLELVAEADAFDVEIVVGEVQFFAKRDEGVSIAEEDAEDVGEFDDHLAGEIGLGADERGDGVEGVEEEVGVDLALKSVEASFKEEPGLLF
jgi:hypothetical protein